MVSCVYVFCNEIVLYLVVGLVFNRFYVKIANYGKSLPLGITVPCISPGSLVVVPMNDKGRFL